MRIRKSGYGVKRAARRVAHHADRLLALTVHRVTPRGPRRSVVVVGIYREEQPILAAVDELRRSRHHVRFHLGAMGAVPDSLREQTTASEMKAGKFQNLNVLTDDMGEPDWLVIIDDDVVLPVGFLNAAIGLCERLDFALAQPAQTRFSNANWRLTKQHFMTVARQTRFVEIGPVTLVRADAQKLLLPFPADLRYGWGLDFHWASIMEEAGMRVGVLDTLAVVHASRKVASTYSWDAAQEEGRAYLAGVPHLPPSIAESGVIARHRMVPRSRVL